MPRSVWFCIMGSFRPLSATFKIMPDPSCTLRVQSAKCNSFAKGPPSPPAEWMVLPCSPPPTVGCLHLPLLQFGIHGKMHHQKGHRRRLSILPSIHLFTFKNASPPAMGWHTDKLGPNGQNQFMLIWGRKTPAKEGGGGGGRSRQNNIMCARLWGLKMPNYDRNRVYFWPPWRGLSDV